MMNFEQQKKLKRLLEIFDAIDGVRSLIKPFETKDNYKELERTLIHLENTIREGADNDAQR